MKPDMDTSPLVFDVETCGLTDAVDYLEPIPDAVPDESPIEAAKNLVDPVKVTADLAKRRLQRDADNAEAQITVERKRAERLEKTALDWNTARIVALGRWIKGVRTVDIASNAFEEREMLHRFWTDASQRMLVGFRIREFDLPMLMQRSLYLEVPCVRFDLGKFARGTNVIDLYDWLTFNDLRGETVMRRSLKSFCTRLGIHVPDGVDGSEIPALVAAEQWDQIEAHCAADVDLTVALALRCGVITKPEPTTGQLVEQIRQRQQDAEMVL